MSERSQPSSSRATSESDEERVRGLPDVPAWAYGAVAAPVLAAGFGVGLAYGIRSNRRREKAPEAQRSVPVAGGARPALHGDGVRLALKALGAGTLLCAAGAVVGVYAVSEYLDVHSVDEFISYMQRSVPKRAAQLSENIQPAVRHVAERARSAVPGDVEREEGGVWKGGSVGARVSSWAQRWMRTERPAEEGDQASEGE